MEEFRPITSCRGKIITDVAYQISESGVVVSNKRQTPLIRKPRIRDRTLWIILIINGERKEIPVYVLVAETFLQKPPGHDYIICIDGNRTNCHKNNLKWTDDPHNNNNMGPWEIANEYSRYEICPLGIRSLETKQLLTISDRIDDYPSVHLCTEDGKKIRSIHILMAKQYVPNPNNLPIVNHKDGNKNNFHYSNLEWVTASQNSQHAIDNGLSPITLGGSRIIEEINNLGEVIHTYPSIIDMINSAEYNYRYICNQLNEHNIVIINDRIFRHKLYMNLEGEIWKSINTRCTDVNRRYQVSNKARVKNIRGDILTSNLKGAYYRMHMTYMMNGKSCQIKESLHRLVAFAFLEFTDRNHQVNHIDKNTLNNNLENLEILPAQQHNEKDHGKPVVGISNTSEYITFPSIASAARAMGTAESTIGKAAKRNGSSKGYRWYFRDSDEYRQIDITELTLKIINPIPEYVPTRVQPITPTPMTLSVISKHIISPVTYPAISTPITPPVIPIPTILPTPVILPIMSPVIQNPISLPTPINLIITPTTKNYGQIALT